MNKKQGGKVNLTGRLAITMFFIVLMILQSFPAYPAPATPDGARDAAVAPAAGPAVTAADSEPGYLRTNNILNPSFEYHEPNGVPSDWDIYGTCHKVINTTYEEDVHTGLRACDMRVKGTDQWSSTAYIYRYFNYGTVPYLSQGILLDFQTKVVSSPDLQSGARWYVVVGIYGSDHWRYLYYYLSSSTVYETNSSTYCYFLLNSTIGSWTEVSRNITADLEEGFSMSADPSNYIYYIYWYLSSTIDPSGVTEVIMDTVSLANRTSYEFMTNGGFESGPLYWNPPSSESPAYAVPCTLATEGSYSVNLTSSSAGDQFSGYTRIQKTFGDPRGIFVAASRGPSFDFDWWYSDVSNSGYPHAYFQLERRGADDNYYTYTWFLGAQEGYSVGGNSTNYWYLFAPGYGSEGSWNHFSIDVRGFLEDIGQADGAIVSFQISANIGSFGNSSVTLLVDDFMLLDYPARDPGFEQDFSRSYSQPFTGWWTNYGNLAYMNYTTDSHSGAYAANLTPYSGYAGLYVSPYTPIDESMLTSFWWRLDSLGLSSSAFYAFIRLEFNWSYSIYYVIAEEGLSFGNSSSSAAYRVAGFNTTDVWHRVMRNITLDLVSAFGPGDYMMNYLIVEAYSSSAVPISVLFDDMHLIDGIYPEISDTQRVTAEPVYYSPVQVGATVTDNRNEIDAVTIHYLYSGDWYSTAATSVGDFYTASIPAYPWDTEVLWYVNATDYSGNIRIDDNGGVYYSYVVGDDLPPGVEITYPETGRVLSGWVQIAAEASDEGSEIDVVQFFVGDTLLAVDSSAPFTCMWNTRTAANGTQTVTARAYDHAGLSELTSHVVDVQNDVSGPQLSALMTSPSDPQYDEDVVVIVGVTDATMTDNVTLHYRFDGGSWTWQEMTPSGALYAALIPGQPWDTHVDYYVKAYDTFGQVSYMGVEPSPFTYVVTDSEAPVIFVSGPRAGENLTGTVEFTYSVSDSGSGFGSLTVLINGEISDTLTTAAGAFELDTTSLENGAVIVVFFAEDAAGNFAEVELSYVVANPLGLDALVASLSGFMSQFGFFVGVGAVVILFGVGRALTGRRAASAAASAPKATKKK